MKGTEPSQISARFSGLFSGTLVVLLLTNHMQDLGLARVSSSPVMFLMPFGGTSKINRLGHSLDWPFCFLASVQAPCGFSMYA